jgi:hypothetical protein
MRVLPFFVFLLASLITMLGIASALMLPFSQTEVMVGVIV